MLRVVTLCLLAISAVLGGSNAYFNELRASTGCGPDYSWVFSHEKGLKLALEIAMPILSLGVVSYFASVNRSVRVLSVFVASIIFLFSCFAFFSSYLSGYAPCDSKGDETSFAVLLVTIFLWGAWVVWASILFFISSHQKPANE